MPLVAALISDTTQATPDEIKRPGAISYEIVNGLMMSDDTANCKAKFTFSQIPAYSILYK